MQIGSLESCPSPSRVFFVGITRGYCTILALLHAQLVGHLTAGTATIPSQKSKSDYSGKNRNALDAPTLQLRPAHLTCPTPASPLVRRFRLRLHLHRPRHRPLSSTITSLPSLHLHLRSCSVVATVSTSTPRRLASVHSAEPNSDDDKKFRPATGQCHRSGRRFQVPPTRGPIHVVTVDYASKRAVTLCPSTRLMRAAGHLHVKVQGAEVPLLT
jgi:hypothetical protein